MLAEGVLFALGILFALCYVLSAKKEKTPSNKIGVFGEAYAVEKKPIAVNSQTIKAFFCPVMIVYLIVALSNMIYLLIA